MRTRTASIGVVALGGALGTLSRYGATRLHPAAPGTFPWTTLLVNLAGAALIGALAGRGWVGPTNPAALAVSAGFLGAFTTFSALSVETVLLVDAGRPVPAIAYVLGTVVGGLGVCAAAWRVTGRRRWPPRADGTAC